MKLKNLILLFLLCFGITAIAQEAEVETDTDTDTEYKYANRHALGISIGTTGLGLEYAYNFHQHINARLRASKFSVTDYTVEMDLSGQPVQIIGNTGVTTIDLLVEYLPFKGSSFKLVGGAGYFMDGYATAQVVYNGTIQYGDITLDKEEIGNITIGLDYSGINPYMGLGFGRAVPKRRVGFSMEVGTYYGGSPGVILTAEKMFEPTATEEKAQLEENLKDYSWLPYFTFKLAFRI